MTSDVQTLGLGNISSAQIVTELTEPSCVFRYTVNIESILKYVVKLQFCIEVVAWLRLHFSLVKSDYLWLASLHE